MFVCDRSVCQVYSQLEAISSATAEERARAILRGLQARARVRERECVCACVCECV